MKKIVTSQELKETAKRVAQSKRFKSLQDRKNYVMNELQDCPPLLCLNELANKSRLPYQLLRRLIIEENKIPYVKVSNKYYINYNHFLQYMDELS
ncbi:Uncharacterised protein [[Ruminococcus] torques]|uniref:DNA-binding protein n=1 Tax=[Ruminococcus] torques TaxID=33039 RepID=A0A564SDB1_9FIRM|nr:hypothetical protein [[Ruminococcus] torques]VUW92570.1 Uncharacterised protein [[Ruminococcus] torques]